MTEEQRADIMDERHLLEVLDSLIASIEELQAAVADLRAGA